MRALSATSLRPRAGSGLHCRHQAQRQERRADAHRDRGAGRGWLAQGRFQYCQRPRRRGWRGNRAPSGIARISFTGSSAVGQHPVATGAPTMKRVMMELGGKSPTLVLDTWGTGRGRLSVTGLSLGLFGVTLLSRCKVGRPPAFSGQGFGSTIAMATLPLPAGNGLPGTGVSAPHMPSIAKA